MSHRNNPHEHSKESFKGFCSNRTKWLAEHRAQYGGQWVAFDGEQFLCHGSNREVLAEARRRGVKVPYVAYIEPLNVLPFGGW